LTRGGRAAYGGATPSYGGGSCSDVACHGARLQDPPAVVPSWKDPSGAASACGACHGIPPLQHTSSTSCDRSNCHGAEIARGIGSLGITDFGKTLHVNGVIDTAQ
jgi:predicted CxxxxCH...CXXCH cytochrome family protein